MYTGLQHAHSGLAYLLLAALIFAILYNLIGFMGNKPFTEGNRKIALIGLIAAHIQLVIGLVLYFVSPNGLSNFSGANMKDSGARLLMLEHPLMMILAIVLITVGYSRAKKLQDSNQKYKKILIFFTLGLILILSRIPWSAWL
jgi:NADH:ubiquinone oxidoreductase subunit 2 (subunit N)